MYFSVLLNLVYFTFKSIDPYSYWLGYFPSWRVNPLEVHLKFCTSDFLSSSSLLVGFHQFPLCFLLRISKEANPVLYMSPPHPTFSCYYLDFQSKISTERRKVKLYRRNRNLFKWPFGNFQVFQGINESKPLSL